MKTDEIPEEPNEFSIAPKEYPPDPNPVEPGTSDLPESEPGQNPEPAYEEP